MAAKNQKILVLRKEDFERLEKNNTHTASGLKGKIKVETIKIEITFTKKPKNLWDRIINCFFRIFPCLKPKYSAEVVRAGECPNGVFEISKPDGGKEIIKETTLVLVEWEAESGAPEFGEIEAITSISPFIVAAQFRQFYNLIISEDPAGNPGPPIRTSKSWITKIHPSELRSFVESVKSNWYFSNSQDCVAVLDTGLKFDQCWEFYKDKAGDIRKFEVARPVGTTCSINGEALGYNAVTDYLKIYKMAVSDLGPRFSSLPNHLQKIYEGINSKILSEHLTREQIINTPYDDNKVDEINEVGCKNDEVGRHGTILSAIINQRSNLPILTIKIFNAAGHGTFFDLLCGLNYVLAQKKAGLKIKAVNASFEGVFIEDGPELNFLCCKFKALKDAGIWVVAAAGNEDLDLAQNKRYPACFQHDNIITVGTATMPFQIAPGNEEDSENDQRTGLTRTQRQQITTDLRLPSAEYIWTRSAELISTNNASATFVKLAVVNTIPGTSILTDEFPSPFGEGDGFFTGTSIAVAYVSAAIAQHVTATNIPSATRETLLIGIAPHVSAELNGTVAGGRFMQIE